MKMVRFSRAKFVIHRAILKVTLAGAVLCLGTAGRSFAAEASTNVLQLRFMTNGVGETVMAHGASNATLNVSKAIANKGAQYSLIPEDATVSLGSEQFPGWSALLPPRQTASFAFDYGHRIMSLTTASANVDLVRLSFPDGASAQMDADAQGRLEFLDDGTYAFFGAGAMTGTNADGVGVRFGNVFPPMVGGQLLAPKTTNANARFARMSPISTLTLMGQIDAGVGVKVGDQVVPLESGVTREVKTTNGAAISLRRNPETRSIDFTVQRGLFRINVDSFKCWKCLGTSGQSASLQWDTNGFLIELKNKNGKGAFQKTVLVNLNTSLNVAVGDSASFQYGRLGDCSTFLAAASGGETTMYNAISGRYVRLDSGNMKIASGWPEGTRPQEPAGARTPVRLTWSSDGKVQVKGAGGECTVAAGEEGVLSAGGLEVQVSYGGPNQLALRADAGSVAVTPDFMPNVAIEFGAGAAVTMGYDRGSDIFQVTPDPLNTSPVGLRTPSGLFPSIGQGAPVTFVINRSNLSLQGAEGALVFSETAGAGAPANNAGIVSPPLATGFGGGTALSSASETLDASRIVQPPVTSSE